MNQLKTIASIVFTGVAAFACSSPGKNGGGNQAAVDPNQQAIAFQCASFKANLIADGIDTNKDGEISIAEAKAVNRELDYVYQETARSFSSLGTGENWLELPITSLTGIEYFVNVTELNLQNHNFTEVDLSKNTKLTSINLDKNPLASLNLGPQPKLKKLSINGLSAQNAEITELDLSQMPALEQLYINSSFNIKEVKLATNSNLTTFELKETQIPHLDVSNNAMLSSLVIEPLKNKKLKLTVSEEQKNNYNNGILLGWKLGKSIEIYLPKEHK